MGIKNLLNSSNTGLTGLEHMISRVGIGLLAITPEVLTHPHRRRGEKLKIG
jgi:hypothetical protein